MGSNDDVVFIPMPSQQQQHSGNVPLPPRMDRSDFIDKIKPEQAVELIRHRFMGEEWKNNVWVPVKALEDRKLSETGAWEVANLMLGVSTINMTISKFKEEAIKRRARNMTKTVQLMLVGNWKSYNIKNSSMLYYVHQIMFSNTLAVLNQADEASIQELLKQTVDVHRTENVDKKEGIGSRIKRALTGG